MSCKAEMHDSNVASGCPLEFRCRRKTRPGKRWPLKFIFRLSSAQWGQFGVQGRSEVLRSACPRIKTFGGLFRYIGSSGQAYQYWQIFRASCIKGERHRCLQHSGKAFAATSHCDNSLFWVALCTTSLYPRIGFTAQARSCSLHGCIQRLHYVYSFDCLYYFYVCVEMSSLLPAKLFGIDLGLKSTVPALQVLSGDKSVLS